MHGIGTGHRLWLRQIERFQATHFVVAPDLPGLTAGTGGAVSIPAIAQNLSEQLVAERLDEINVCGISAGASVALALVLCAGPRIARLVLSAPQVRAPRLMLGLQIAITALLPEKTIINVSKAMLGSDPEIAQAAAEVGYESEAAFNRAFKRQYGLPPARYRKINVSKRAETQSSN